MPDEMEPENVESLENQECGQWALVLLMPKSCGEELEISPGLDLAEPSGADSQGWENGQNASVGNPAGDPAGGDQRHRGIGQCDDSEDQGESLWVSKSGKIPDGNPLPEGGALLPAGISEEGPTQNPEAPKEQFQEFPGSQEWMGNKRNDGLILKGSTRSFVAAEESANAHTIRQVGA